MTEAEWLVTTDPNPMLKFLKNRVRASDRKLRLYAVSLCRLMWPDFPNDRCRQAVIAAELFADSRIDESDLSLAREGALDTYDLIIELDFEGVARARVAAETAAFPVIVPELRGSTSYLRDLFGNPFRPTAFDHTWGTSTVLALAQGIYDDSAFDCMPILADALQDAGCEQEDMLSHCRSDGPHVKGCWVIDFLLKQW
jgi:hypothetical protein